MNVSINPWIPVIRKDGTKDIVSPFEITSKPKNPIVLLNFGRPDLNAAGIRSLICFYNTFLAPKSRKKWKDLFHNPPNSNEILAQFKTQFFELDGDGPRFLQDKQPNDLIKTLNVGHLLFDTPGAKTVKDKKAFFIRPKIHIFCPSCAIAALFLAQYSATMAGVGYRTSITSGANGSLTIIITGKTIWETIWSNVIVQKDMLKLGGNSKGLIFPWLSDTVDSTNKATISLDDMHPYYPLWEMPLRLHLIFEKNDSACTICNSHSNLMVKTIKAKNYGNCYIEPRHILSPSIKAKEFSFRKPIDFPNYTDIVTYLFPSEKVFPSEVVTHFMSNVKDLNPNQFGLKTFGFHMDKAKLFAWQEHHYAISELLYKDKDFTSDIARYSYLVGWYINNDVRKMWHIERSDPLIFDEFMKDTEEIFYKVLETQDLKVWLESMVVQAFSLFEKYVRTQKPGLQMFFKEQFIEIINKKVTKPLELEELDFQDFIHIEYRKLRLPHFNREFSQKFLSWYGKIRSTEKRKIFSQEDSLETINNQEIFLKFLSDMSDFLPVLRSDKMKEKFAAALLIVFKAKELNFSENFPTQMALQNINKRHIDEIIAIKDVVKDWNVFRDIVGQLDGLNVISFLEGYIYWSRDVKIYWEKEFIKNT